MKRRLQICPKLQSFVLGYTCLLLALVSLWKQPLLAQTAGTITGRVHDRSGAVLEGVRITAIGLDQGRTRVAASDRDGRFVLPGLPAGRYEVRAELDGFRPVIHRDLRLEVGGTSILDLFMELGEVHLVLNVEGRSSLVNARTPELSYLVSEDAIKDLPLNGRNYTDLAYLQPAVVPYPHRDGGSVVAHGLGMSVNGQDPRSNVYLLDGTTQNDFTNGPAGSAAGTALGMETIREFRIEVNAYSAEFGRNSGGQVNAISKSGGNQAHGSLYQYHRNDNLDARNFFDPSDNPEFKRNQFGGSFGGPLQKEKTFFFAGYEALRERLGRTIFTIVPEDNARQGFLPDATRPGQFVNVGVNDAVRPYLEAFPVANGPARGDGLADHTFGFRQVLNQHFFQTRIDRNVRAYDQMFLRYTFDDAGQRLPTDYPQFPRSFLSRNQFLTAEYRHVASPRLLNTVRLGFSRTRIGQDVEANLRSPLAPFVPGQSLVGNIDIGGMPRFGPQTSVNVKLTQNVFGLEDSLVYIREKHSLKLGGLAERYQDNMVNPTFSLGIYTFGGIRDFLQNRPQRFLGLPPNGALDRYWRFTLLGVYVQDDYQLASSFNLSLGLRYEFATMPRDLYGRDSALMNLADAVPTVGQLYRNPTGKNLSPRFGFAWDPSGQGTTSVRAGFGIYFNTNNQQNLIVTVTNPPATPRIGIANPTFPNVPFERGVGNTIRPVEWNIKNPNVAVWNLNLQQQLWGDTLATLGYAGSRGVHLLRSGDVNVPTPERLADGTLFFPANAVRPNNAFATIELKRSDGDSAYHAMIAELRKRWSQGVSFQSSYTFSRNIDNTQASTFFSDATNGTTSAFPEFFGLNYNRGLADYHAKHSWVGNFTWELPWGRSLAGAAGLLLRDWQVSGIAVVRSGNPLTAFVQRNRSRSQWAPSLGPGIGFDRPSLAAGRTHESAVLGKPDRYFDASAFVLQPAGTFGALGRGTFIGPDLRTLDLSTAKTFAWRRLGEGTRIQIRAEIFNLFNRANFAPPALIAFNGQTDNEPPVSSFGRIRSTITSARQIQFGFRIAF